ncbi:MAG TPA: polysaccharide biosynthesis C-terminal domain-containing protein, partial [Acidimicrobiales bacterium]
TGQVGLVVVAAALVARGMNRDWISLGAQRYARALTPALVQPAVMFAGALVVSSLIGAAVVIAVASVAWLAVSIALHPVRARASAVLEPVDGWYARFAIADQVVASSDSLLLVAIRSAREAGIYSAVYRFPNAWMIVVGLAVSAMLPGVTRRVVDDPASYPAMRRRALRFAAVGAAVVAAGSVAVAIVGPLLLGDEYRDGRVPLAILLAGAVVLTAHAPLRPLYAAVGSDRALALVTSGVALANVAGNLLVIPAYGMVGAATTTLLAQVALFAFTFVATKRFAVRREQAA